MRHHITAVPALSIQTGITAAAGLAIDAALLRAALADGCRRVAIWTSEASLVVSRRDALLPGFAAARAILGAEGVPVLVRDSGGTAVLQGPGLVTLSMVHVSSAILGDSYGMLRDVVAAAIAPWGIEVGLGSVDGAFCDGRHNLIVGSRKIAGTAQRRRHGHSPIALVHAVLLVDVDVAAMTQGINRFYTLAGAPREFLPGSCVSLRDLLPLATREIAQQAIDQLSIAAQEWLAATAVTGAL
jgi:octanoyl-[GcvH]:protein N-octanoyltransferase